MRRYSVSAARAAVLFYWLNPAAILDGAVLGYLDPWLGAPGGSLLALEARAVRVVGAGECADGALKLQIIDTSRFSVWRSAARGPRGVERVPAVVMGLLRPPLSYSRRSSGSARAGTCAGPAGRFT